MKDNGPFLDSGTTYFYAPNNIYKYINCFKFF